MIYVLQADECNSPKGRFSSITFLLCGRCRHFCPSTLSGLEKDGAVVIDPILMQGKVDISESVDPPLHVYHVPLRRLDLQLYSAPSSFGMQTGFPGMRVF
jgi:hypothetical protein